MRQAAWTRDGERVAWRQTLAADAYRGHLAHRGRRRFTACCLERFSPP